MLLPSSARSFPSRATWISPNVRAEGAPPNNGSLQCLLVFPSGRADWSPLFTFYGSGWRRFRDLRWMHGPVVVVAILTRPDPRTPRRALCPSSPAQPWAIFFHPPPPPIALQSLTRDAPFPKWRWRDAVFEGPYTMILLSLLVLLQRDAFGFREHDRRSEASA